MRSPRRFGPFVLAPPSGPPDRLRPCPSVLCGGGRSCENKGSGRPFATPRGSPVSHPIRCSVPHFTSFVVGAPRTTSFSSAVSADSSRDRATPRSRRPCPRPRSRSGRASRLICGVLFGSPSPLWRLCGGLRLRLSAAVGAPACGRRRFASAQRAAVGAVPRHPLTYARVHACARPLVPASLFTSL